MSGRLTSHAVVLAYSFSHRDGVVFSEPDASSGYREEITLAPHVWDDMGHPTQITVSVLPGESGEGDGLRGPIHELAEGVYRAVIRAGVPMIERDNQVGAVTAVFVPVTPPLLSELESDWSRPLQFMVDPSGEFVFKEADRG